jgi:ribosomal protein S18 acetylase RimI-like enzyme
VRCFPPSCEVLNVRDAWSRTPTTHRIAIPLHGLNLIHCLKMTTFAPSIRPAYFSEQPRMATVCTAAFQDDALLADIFHPHQKQYPKDVDLFYLRGFQLEWFNSRHHYIVSTVSDEARPGKDLVVGVAHWVRLGKGVKRGWNPLLHLMRRVMEAWVSTSSWIWPNRAADPTKTHMFEESWPFIKHLWTGDRANCWDLHLLAVHPSYGGLGIGKQLVKWGLRQAEEEGVSASVKMA